jgi:RNA polymerase sigma-70 factor, ECF subfamily
MPTLLELLAEDITLWSDGGGRIRAALNPIYGPEKVTRFLLGVLRKTPPTFVSRLACVNGQPGIVGYMEGRPASVLTLDTESGRIRAIRVVVNPEKLRTIPPLS